MTLGTRHFPQKGLRARALRFAPPALLTLAPLLPAQATELVMGTRVWVSSGQTEWSHCASLACGGSAGTLNLNGTNYSGQLGDPTSRLHYGDVTGTSAEVFAQATFKNALRLSGTLGAGRGDGGQLRDQDWLTWDTTGQTYSLSDTTSTLKNTRLSHFTLDLGRSYTRDALKLTPFLGYVQYKEKTSAVGVTQLPNDLGIDWGNPYNSNTAVIDNTITWKGWRLGTEVEWAMTEKAQLMVNAAYVVAASARNNDSHLLRTNANDLGPAPNITSNGNGDGWMLDLIGRYALSPKLSLEAGWRWWKFKAEGNTRFGPDFSTAYPTRSLQSERNGVLVGVRYMFD